MDVNWRWFERDKTPLHMYFGVSEAPRISVDTFRSNWIYSSLPVGLVVVVLWFSHCGHWTSVIQTATYGSVRQWTVQRNCIIAFSKLRGAWMIVFSKKKIKSSWISDIRRSVAFENLVYKCGCLFGRFIALYHYVTVRCSNIDCLHWGLCDLSEILLNSVNLTLGMEHDASLTIRHWYVLPSCKWISFRSFLFFTALLFALRTRCI